MNKIEIIQRHWPKPSKSSVSNIPLMQEAICKMMDEIKGKVHKVSGCNDCPMLHWDREEGIRCEHPEVGDDNEVYLEPKNNEIVLLTPDWCPLNNEPITIVKINEIR